MVPDAVVTVIVELPPELTMDGVNDTRAPAGAPVAPKATVWAAPLVTAVLMVVEAAEPAVVLPEVGDAAMEKSLGGGGGEVPALNRAMPPDQYITAGKLPEKLCAPVVVRFWKPLLTDTVLGLNVVCCGWSR